MTDLLSRPGHTDAHREGARPDPARPLTVSAAFASAGAAATTLVTCLGIAVIGWFLADAGAHGQTTDALRVGADAWLVGHGSQLSVSGVPVGIVPLALTGLFSMVNFRMGRWAAQTSGPLDGDRTLAVGASIYVGIYVVVAVVTFVLAGTAAAAPSLGRTVLGALVMSGLFGTLGMAAGAGRLATWAGLVPGWARSVAFGAAAGALLLVVASSVLVAVSLVMGLNEVATVMSGLHLRSGDYVMFALLTAAVAPNAVLFGTAYLLGPGFAVGTGTLVSPTVVALGPVPAFPLLAALPESGPTPAWLAGVMAVPVLAGAVGAVLAQRSYRVTAYDSAALRGFGCGFGAALLTTAAVALAGGPMGTGRMADLGASLGEVLVASVSAMSLGGLVAGFVTAWWQRRAQRTVA